MHSNPTTKSDMERVSPSLSLCSALVFDNSNPVIIMGKLSACSLSGHCYAMFVLLINTDQARLDALNSARPGISPAPSMICLERN